MSKLNSRSWRGDIGRGCHADPPPTAQAMMPESGEVTGTPRLDFEAWTAFLRTSCGNQPDVTDPGAFTGWVRPISVFGLDAAALKIKCGFAPTEFGRNAYRSARTQRDARLVGADYYYAVFQAAGRSALSQNDKVAQLAVGDVALIDAARPAACFAGDSQWLRLQLPRESLASHLGYELQGGLYARGETPAARLLFDLVRMPTKATGRRSHRPIPTCSLRFTISSARCLRRPIRFPSRAMRNGCLRGFAASSRTALPIRILVLARSQPRRGYRCVICRRFSRRAARPAASSYIRYVWSTPHAFCTAARRWRQASLSARSRTPAAFVTTAISRGDFAIGSGTRQAAAPKHPVAPAVERCAPIPAKGRPRHTTPRLRLSKSCLQARSGYRAARGSLLRTS
jgi:AraC-binding-like domain